MDIRGIPIICITTVLISGCACKGWTLECPAPESKNFKMVVCTKELNDGYRWDAAAYVEARKRANTTISNSENRDIRNCRVSGNPSVSDRQTTVPVACQAAMKCKKRENINSYFIPGSPE